MERSKSDVTTEREGGSGRWCGESKQTLRPRALLARVDLSPGPFSVGHCISWLV